MPADRDVQQPLLDAAEPLLHAADPAQQQQQQPQPQSEKPVVCHPRRARQRLRCRLSQRLAIGAAVVLVVLVAAVWTVLARASALTCHGGAIDASVTFVTLHEVCDPARLRADVRLAVSSTCRVDYVLTDFAVALRRADDSDDAEPLLAVGPAATDNALVLRGGSAGAALDLRVQGSIGDVATVHHLLQLALDGGLADPALPYRLDYRGCARVDGSLIVLRSPACFSGSVDWATVVMRVYNRTSEEAWSGGDCNDVPTSGSSSSGATGASDAMPQSSCECCTLQIKADQFGPGEGGAGLVLRLNVSEASGAPLPFSVTGTMPQIAFRLVSQGRELAVVRAVNSDFAGGPASSTLSLAVQLAPGPLTYFVLHNHPYGVRQELGVAASLEDQQACVLAQLANGLVVPSTWTADVWTRMLVISVAARTSNSIAVAFHVDTSQAMADGIVGAVHAAAANGSSRRIESSAHVDMSVDMHAAGTGCAAASPALHLLATLDVNNATRAVVGTFVFASDDLGMLYDAVMRPAWAERALTTLDWRADYSFASGNVTSPRRPLFACQPRPPANVTILPSMLAGIAASPGVPDALHVALFESSFTVTTQMLAAVFGFVPQLDVPDILCSFTVPGAPSQKLAEMSLSLRPSSFGNNIVTFFVALWADAPEFAAAWAGLSLPGGTATTSVVLASGQFSAVFPAAPVTAEGAFGRDLFAVALDASGVALTAYNPFAGGVTLLLSSATIELCCAGRRSCGVWTVPIAAPPLSVAHLSVSEPVALDLPERLPPDVTSVHLRALAYSINFGRKTTAIDAAATGSAC